MCRDVVSRSDRLFVQHQRFQLIRADLRGCRSAMWSSDDDSRSTPISLMTSVNDFELFHTISGGLRYRRRRRASGSSYDKTHARPFALWKDALLLAAFYRADPRFRVLVALVDERRSRLCPRGPENVCKQIPRDGEQCHRTVQEKKRSPVVHSADVWVKVEEYSRATK